ncbi:PREDICTED: UDP-glycosyltransferase 89B2-like [Nicotiana attenuata]|uniref:Glycosyltransferase n=1 Tax=Nicotiana attenuata TaxID=49451 RepID=A0A2I2MNF5_NICAT|nr:PREDICTED: UDP-glycosyltransferase 89B2-like [Nicotiana attenuata]AQQ16666.1 UDP-glycosyltransferase g20981 [Nicotiana attenuata]OIT32957.1 udp-glycosyltransferase 89b1 [Nicotiana attenuata]
MFENRPHALIFPYPAQGHMLPLLDFTHQLFIRDIAITILVTPKNLPILNPLLSQHPSINTLILPFPSHPSIPDGVENVKDLPADGFRSMMYTLGKLQDPILDWFNNHPSPPSAIISDMFLGFTHEIATQLGIRRYVFSTSGALALSVVYSLWSEMPQRKNTNDENEIFELPNIPNCPKFPWWQLSPIFRSYVKGDPNSEFIRKSYLADIASHGLVVNTFTELESVYLDHLMKDLGHDRVWAVGPVLPPHEENDTNNFGSSNRGGSSSILASEILAWLDTCEDNSVVYVCFGSQAVLTNKQMEELAIALEKSGVKFIWSAKRATKGHVSNDYGVIPSWFEEKVAGRGLVIRDWAPQVLILKHRAAGAFLTHCGWNSTLEGLVAGVPMLTWPMGADQFANANLLVDEHKVATRASEGAKTISNSDELAKLLAEAVEGKGVERRERASELRKAASNGIKEGGNSFKDLEMFVKHLSEEATKIKRLNKLFGLVMSIGK